MRRVVELRRIKLSGRFDALFVGLPLALALLLPIAFLVPYKDEWLRMVYLADHSPWAWMVEHARTWVVRPTAESIMAVMSFATARREFHAPLTAAAFLVRFQALYVLLVGALFALLYALALALTGPARAARAFAVFCGCMAICVLMSDDLQYALYWADGYANVVLPFSLLVLALILIAQGGSKREALGAVLLIAAAFGHEVLCIYAIGFSALMLVMRLRRRTRSGLAYLLLAAALCGVLYVQTFSAGPSERSALYFQRTGVRYNWLGAWHGVELIDPVRSALAFVSTLLLLATARTSLQPWLRRATQHARAHRVHWMLLAIGALLTSLLPLASVGLKKANPGIGSYSMATELFVILSAALAYPLLDGWIGRWTAGWRRRVSSVVPILLVLLPLSNNPALYVSACRDFRALHAAAEEYMRILCDSRGHRVSVMRPCHPFSKPASGMSSRYAALYFGAARVKERRCRF